MTEKELYTPPSQEIFEDIKASAIKLWQTYDDEHGYATGKVNRIKDLENVGDNWGTIVAMFDYKNQNKLETMVELEDTKDLIHRALLWSRAGVFGP